jgi:hypothetical protein
MRYKGFWVVFLWACFVCVGYAQDEDVSSEPKKPTLELLEVDDSGASDTREGEALELLEPDENLQIDDEKISEALDLLEQTGPSENIPELDESNSLDGPGLETIKVPETKVPPMNYDEYQICKKRVFLDYKRKLIERKEAISKLRTCRASATFSKSLENCKAEVVRAYKAKSISRDIARERLVSCPDKARKDAKKVVNQAEGKAKRKSRCIQSVLSRWLIEKTISKDKARSLIADCKAGSKSLKGCTAMVMTDLREGRITEAQARERLAECLLK